MQVNMWYISISFILEMYLSFSPNHKNLILIHLSGNFFIMFLQNSHNNSHDSVIILTAD